jgi:excisionase family DNA binding protein
MGAQNMVTSSKLGKSLGLSKATINRLAKEGRIPFIILPSGHRRFDTDQVTAALSNDLMSLAMHAPIDGERK